MASWHATCTANFQPQHSPQPSTPLTPLQTFYMHLAATSESCSSLSVPLAPASHGRQALGDMNQSLAQVTLSLAECSQNEETPAFESSRELHCVLCGYEHSSADTAQLVVSVSCCCFVMLILSLTFSEPSCCTPPTPSVCPCCCQNPVRSH